VAQATGLRSASKECPLERGLILGLRRDELRGEIGPAGWRLLTASIWSTTLEKGLGDALLADALERSVLATRNLGARFVVVDALHERAATFYVHYGFKRIPGTSRLVQKMSSIEASLAESD
jgi:hypothetical protein